MSIDDKMPFCERRKYLNTVKKRYDQASERERGVLLSEMEAVTVLRRTSLIRLMGQPSLTRQPRQRHRGRTYGPELDESCASSPTVWITSVPNDSSPIWFSRPNTRHSTEN